MIGYSANGGGKALQKGKSNGYVWAAQIGKEEESWGIKR